MSLQITLTPIQIEFDKKFIRSALRGAGTLVAKAAKASILATQGAGRTYGSHTASAPGQAPASWTGALASSMSTKASRGGLSVSVVDAAHYALFLEVGAVGGGGVKNNRNIRGNVAGKKTVLVASSKRVLAPRPFLSAALDANAPEIEKRLFKAVDQGLLWKSTK